MACISHIVLSSTSSFFTTDFGLMVQNEEPMFEFDLDTLQAQVNMAMAETEELVSSWVPPSKKSTQRPKKSTQEMENEVKEYLRRPPRLGVGAPIPEPIGPSAQEEAKLKNKLIGNGKKRRREDETLPKPEEEVDDKENRKGESSTKIVRLDPFSQLKKKAKHKEPINKGITKSTRVRDMTVQMHPVDSSNTSGANAKHGEDETKACSFDTDDANCGPFMNGTTTTARGFPHVGDPSAVHDGIEKHDKEARSSGFSAGTALSTLVGQTQAQLLMPMSSPKASQDVPTSPTLVKKRKKKKKKRKFEQPNGAISASSLPSQSLIIGESDAKITGNDKSSTTTTSHPNGVIRGLSGRSLPRENGIGLVPNGQASYSVAADKKGNNEAESKEAEGWIGFDGSLDNMDIDSGPSHDDEDTTIQVKPNGIPSSGGCGPSIARTQRPVPLLNSSCLPPSNIDNTCETVQSSSSKRKRNHRKKKKKQRGLEKTENGS